MFCKNCGMKIADDSKFCVKCGTQVTEVPKDEIQHAQQPANQPISQPAEQPTPQPAEQPISQLAVQPVSQPAEQQDIQPMPGEQKPESGRIVLPRKRKGTRKGLIAVCALLLVAAVGGAGVYFFLQRGESDDRQQAGSRKKDDTEFSGEETDEEGDKIIEMYSYTGDGKTLTMENEYLLFEMDGWTTQFTVKDKKSGNIWYSNPEGALDDPIVAASEKSALHSALLLTYIDDATELYTTFSSYAKSVDSGYYEIEDGKDEQGEFIKVSYSISNMRKVFIIPEVISETRMNELLDQMDSIDEKNFVQRYYKRYDINNLDKRDDRDELLARYPLLESEVIFVFRDTAGDTVQYKLEAVFQTAGYTYEDFLEDKAVVVDMIPEPVFNVSMVYRLDGDRLSVEIPVKEIEYQKKYFSLYDLTVLPYFGAGSKKEEGYIMLPEENGAMMYFNGGKGDYQDSNVFGIVRNGTALLCILEEGADCAAVSVDCSGTKNSFNSAIPTYTLLSEKGDSGKGSRDNSAQKKSAVNKLKLCYFFIPSGDYEDIVNIYRQYMQEK